MPYLFVAIVQGLYLLIRTFFLNFFTRLWVFILAITPIALNKIIKLLGIGVISYVGIDIAIDGLSEFLINKLNGLPSDMLQIFLIMKIDAGFKIVFTAMTIAISFKLMHQSTRLIWNKPGSSWEA